MTRRVGTTVASLAALVGLAALTSSIALAQSTTREKPKTQTPPSAPKVELPPGMTEKDMQACMEAAIPGPQHAFLAEAIGTWKGKTKMWMAPGTEPQESTCTSIVSPLFEGGQFTKCEIKGEMPGMGMFHGFGTYGFDNVSQKFQSSWCDNMGTGMMWGTGERSSDGKVLTWSFTYNCPITKKAMVMREVETRTGKDSYTLEMFGPDRESGKEFKMMEIAFNRVPGSTATGSAH